MKPKILITDAEVHIENVVKDLSEVADLVASESNNDEETLIRESEDTALIIASCFTRISSGVIEQAKKLKGIVKYGVGVDNIDLKAATNRGVLVVNCPEYGSDTVADHAFMLMICLARKIIAIDNVMRKKAWVWTSPEYMGMDISGKTVGIIGFGRIGRAMARRAGGFGMKRIAFDPYVECETFRQFDVEPVNLDELLDLSDFVSIHCILTPQTRGLIGESELKKMKKTAFIIDVSRAAIIEEEALIKALKEGWIAGAGLDVFSEEPLSPENPLFNMDNVILTPHLAWYTEEALERLEKETAQRALEILQGRIPKNIMNLEVLKKLR